jgi:hypothetical protein
MRSAQLMAIGMMALAALPVSTGAQPPAPADPDKREMRVEVRDRSGRPIAAARIDLPERGDTAITDSSGIAHIEFVADSLITISVRKIGYEPRAARLRMPRAPAFIVRVTMGALGQRLPEVTVKANYPGEPWREAFEARRRNSSGMFRDLSYFNGRQILQLDDWFGGMPGVQISNRSVRVNRCSRIGVWIDGVHLTSGGLSPVLAFQQITGNDVAAVELYRIAQQQAQYSDPNREDCSILLWTRSR